MGNTMAHQGCGAMDSGMLNVQEAFVLGSWSWRCWCCRDVRLVDKGLCERRPIVSTEVVVATLASLCSGMLRPCPGPAWPPAVLPPSPCSSFPRPCPDPPSAVPVPGPPFLCSPGLRPHQPSEANSRPYRPSPGCQGPLPSFLSQVAPGCLQSIYLVLYDFKPKVPCVFPVSPPTQHPEPC